MTTAAQIMHAKAACIGEHETFVDAAASVEHMLAIMEEHQVRRLPVIDSDHRLVGIVSEADIARHLPEHAIAQFVTAICAQQAITGR